MIDTCQHCSTSRANQALRSLANAGFQNRGVCLQAFPSFPSPSTHFHFLALVSFLARPKRRIPFLGLSLLRNQTEMLVTQARIDQVLYRCVTNADCRLAQVNELNVVVKCFNRFPVPKHLKVRDRESVRSFPNSVYLIFLQVCTLRLSNTVSDKSVVRTLLPKAVLPFPFWPVSLSCRCCLLH